MCQQRLGLWLIACYCSKIGRGSNHCSQTFALSACCPSSAYHSIVLICNWQNSHLCYGLQVTLPIAAAPSEAAVCPSSCASLHRLHPPCSSFSTYRKNCCCSKFIAQHLRSWAFPTTPSDHPATSCTDDSASWLSCGFCWSCWIAGFDFHSQDYSWPEGPRWWPTPAYWWCATLCSVYLHYCLVRSWCYSQIDSTVAVSPRRWQFSWYWNSSCIRRSSSPAPS